MILWVTLLAAGLFIWFLTKEKHHDLGRNDSEFSRCRSGNPEWTSECALLCRKYPSSEDCR